jgi:hypothetical protein
MTVGAKESTTAKNDDHDRKSAREKAYESSNERFLSSGFVLFSFPTHAR